jgi:hypothetical protein
MAILVAETGLICPKPVAVAVATAGSNRADGRGIQGPRNRPIPSFGAGRLQGGHMQKQTQSV